MIGSEGVNLIAFIFNKNSATFSSDSILLFIMQMYKVFIDSLAVYFLKNGTEIKNISVKEAVVISKNSDAIKVIFFEIDRFQKTGKRDLYLICNDVDFIWSLFKNQFDFRVAAGGLVINKKNELLLIFRNGCWDLPKGHVESNETIENGAVREVEEECGITSPKILNNLMITYHTYSHKENAVLKENHWFVMSYDKNEELIPQEKEGIEIVEWKNKEEVYKCMENTYGSIKDVIRFFYTN